MLGGAPIGTPPVTRRVSELERPQCNCPARTKSFGTPDGAVEEDTLSAFNIALDQFHNAVADRKTWIRTRSICFDREARRSGGNGRDSKRCRTELSKTSSAAPDAGGATAGAAVAALVSTGGSRRTCVMPKTSAAPHAATSARDGTTIMIRDRWPDRWLVSTPGLSLRRSYGAAARILHPSALM